MLCQGTKVAFSTPPPLLWKDSDFRCVNVVSKVGCVRAFAICHVGCVFMYKLFEAFGHLSINTKVKLQRKK